MKMCHGVSEIYHISAVDTKVNNLFLFHLVEFSNASENFPL